MSAEAFDAIYARAAKRKGGEGALERLLGQPLTPAELAKVGDDRFLAEFTKKVFQSGFVWRVVRQKWLDFEEIFFGFDIEKVLLMPDEMLERKASDPRIIRNYNKVKTIRDNAIMIADVRQRHGSFAAFVAEWPANDIIGLWEYLKKHGARLGGNTGPYALRFLGKDTFLLSKDVEDYFTQHKLIEGSARSKRSLNTINQTFLEWQRQSGRSLQALSQIVAFSCGDNHIN
ncbi:DNA-3-methyladenine glycosylase I [Alteromonas facilis]|uniref:DNA-3-methyladenine glycosylase I n=1 Tax=Alteromonas facilis TaxID=2048004 RepID=UPI000C289D21|nr:DNA-3-methyladenine glycosylase I [Alteromonas facilis]